MYCPSCGVEYNSKLNYCKRCGAEIFSPEQARRQRPPRLGAMFWAVGAFGLVGLYMLFAGYIRLVSLGLRGDELMIPFFLSFVFIGAVIALLIWQLSRLVTLQHQMTANQYERRTNELPPAPSLQQLPSAAPGDPIPSVVEGTTRQFAPVYRESQGRE